jgi:hypothetical protein
MSVIWDAQKIGYKHPRSARLGEAWLGCPKTSVLYNATTMIV